jgi:hypothetical protein
VLPAAVQLLCTVLPLRRPQQPELAVSCGLAVSNFHLQVVAGLLADIETLHVLRELGMPLDDTVAEAAARSGRLDVLQHLLVEQQCPRSRLLSYHAARSGNISMLQWLRAERLCSFDNHTCEGAVIGGHLAALQHLRNEGFSWAEQYIASQAADGGSIAVLAYLQQQPGVVINAHAMTSAAKAGQLALCKYLRSTGCDWDDRACDEAASWGHFDTLRWLRENGCPWLVYSVLTAAARCGSTAILAYITEQEGETDAELLTRALNSAGAHNKLQAAQWLRQHGAQWPAELKDTGMQWRDDVLAWARAEGCTSPI